jgi:hypothetical protein
MEVALLLNINVFTGIITDLSACGIRNPFSSLPVRSGGRLNSVIRVLFITDLIILQNGVINIKSPLAD